MSSVAHVSAADTYRWLKDRGYSPIEILPQSKHPRNGEGWSSDSYQADPQYFLRQDANVGARLGRGGLRDVDIDCPEAIWYARRLLPATEAVFGRKSAPSTHYLYEVPEDQTAKLALFDPVAQHYNKVNKTPKDHPDHRKASIIDLRGMGQYTVLPGSTHMGTGESIQWEKERFPSATRLDAEELMFAIKLVGMCVLIERHYWLEGMRHDVCRMLAGVFYFLEFDEDTACRLIELVMEKTDDDDQSRLKTVRMTYKKAEEGKKTEGKTKLKAFAPEAASCLDAFSNWFKADKADIVDEYNTKYAVVRYGGDVRIAAFDENEPPEFMRKAAFFDLTMTDTVQIADDNGKLIRVPKAKLWWANPKRAQYMGVTFAPGVDHDDDRLRGKLNLWRGWGVQPSSLPWQEARNGCSMWLSHLRDVVCDGDQELYDWIITWFADIVRNPSRKPGTALALVGGQGAGKTSIFEYFGRILGTAYVKISQQNQLTGNFNSHFQNCLLLHAEEAVFARNTQAQNILKDMITSETTALEKKGQDIVTIPSYFRVAFTSNSDHVVGAEHDDRRYTFVDLKKRKRDRSLKKQYETERDGDGPACLFRYLLDCPDIGTADVTENYITADLASQKFQTNDPIAEWWHETLNSGVLMHPFVNWCQKPELTAWPHTVSTSAIYATYTMWCRNKNVRRVEVVEIFNARLRKMLMEHPSVQPKMKCRVLYESDLDSDDLQRMPHDVQRLGAQQVSIRDFPDLRLARELFEQYSQLRNYEWDPAPHSAEKIERPKFNEEKFQAKQAPGTPTY